MRRAIVLLSGLTLALPLIFGLADAPEVRAQGKGKGPDKSRGVPLGEVLRKGRDAGPAERDAGDVILDVVITAAERAIIGGYVTEKYRSGGLPPGLAKREQLPPGLQRQIERNGTLPPGLAKRLPDDLLGRLPRRSNTGFRVVGDDIVLIDLATRVILDVMHGVLRN